MQKVQDIFYFGMQRFICDEGVVADAAADDKAFGLFAGGFDYAAVQPCLMTFVQNAPKPFRWRTFWKIGAGKIIAGAGGDIAQRYKSCVVKAVDCFIKRAIAALDNQRQRIFCVFRKQTYDLGAVAAVTGEKYLIPAGMLIQPGLDFLSPDTFPLSALRLGIDDKIIVDHGAYLE